MCLNGTTHCITVCGPARVSKTATPCKGCAARVLACVLACKKCVSPVQRSQGTEIVTHGFWDMHINKINHKKAPFRMTVHEHAAMSDSVPEEGVRVNMGAVLEHLCSPPSERVAQPLERLDL